MQLDKHMVVGKSVLSDRGMSDSMIAEMFEAVQTCLLVVAKLDQSISQICEHLSVHMHLSSHLTSSFHLLSHVCVCSDTWSYLHRRGLGECESDIQPTFSPTRVTETCAEATS